MREWRVSRLVGVFLLGSTLVGILAGVLWWAVTPRPGYLVGPDLGASMGERSLAEMFTSDAMFSLLAGIVGLLTGTIAWIWFQKLGWWVCLLAVLGAGLTGVVMWQTGEIVSPGNLDSRLAAAQPGDVVAVDLTLRSMSALLVAPFLAILPIMLFAAFWPENAD